ncbi:MAG TPA: AraC family transcriptional regulator [Actinomycetota bacterium]|nr:AraC family transcriptional regulator [Actinomycetota bacterium]
MAMPAMVGQESREQWVFVGSDIILGRFHCPPGGPGWDEDRAAPQGHLITFPTSSCWIHQDGSEPVVADPATSIFYNPGTMYRRTLLDPRGDHCLYLVTAPELTRECASEWDRSAAQADAYRFPHPTGPVDGRAAALLHVVHRAALTRAGRDPLAMEEALYAALRAAVRGVIRRSSPARTPERMATRRTHAETVEMVKAVVARRFAERLTLADLAAQVFSSPYHLSRVFRSTTGSSIHAYRARVRLQRSLGQIADRDVDLGWLAERLGFADHSHFTNAFHRTFGLSPSSFRRRVRTAAVDEMRTILQV